MNARMWWWRSIVLVVILTLSTACAPATPTVVKHTPPAVKTDQSEGPPISLKEGTQTPEPTATSTHEKEEGHVVKIEPKVLRAGDQWPTRGEPLFALITGPHAWERFLKEQHAHTWSWPDINWEQEVLLVALMGAKRTGGYRIALRQVVITDHQVTVQVEERSPQPGEMVIQVLTSPFQIVAIPRDVLPTGTFTLVFSGKKGQKWEVTVENATEDAMYTAQPTFIQPAKERYTPSAPADR